MSIIEFEKIRVDPLSSLYKKFHTNVDVLRLDLIHPVISGNKWFKLKEYLKDALLLDKTTIATFGGAYSNHILATAATARSAGMQSIGIIRGEKPPFLSSTLNESLNLGMELFFSSREDYKRKKLPEELSERSDADNIYLINEGGYGAKGAEGAKDILRTIDFADYTHIIAAVGTGTTLAGLIAASHKKQKVVGISVLKNNFSLRKEIQGLLPFEKADQFVINNDYHFGGYAKYSPELIAFMNDWYKHTGIPSDFVYTGKLFCAVHELIQKGYFSPESRLLVIHSGGLQGNISLPKGTLIF